MGNEGEQSRDWGDVRFRPRSAAINRSSGDEAGTRFITGAVLFVAVALAYPWYSYWVHSHLLEGDMREALAEIDQQSRQAGIAASAQLQALQPPRRASPSNVASVRVMGISEGTNGSVLVAQLENTTLENARDVLCFQASRWTRRRPDGETFRVQRYRGGAPAVHVGSIRC